MYNPSLSVLTVAAVLMGLAFQGYSSIVSAADAVERAAEGKDIVIENPSYLISFDGDGGLKLVKNKSTDKICFRSYKKTPPFKVFLDVRKESKSFAGSQNNAEMLDSRSPVPLRLVGYDELKGKGKTADAVSHVFTYGNDRKKIEAKLVISVPKEGVYSDWSLVVKNTGASSHRVGVLFPYFEQVSIGPDDSANDQPCGGGAYPYSSKSYGGINISMQWMSRFDSNFDTGIGLIVEDKSFSDKTLYNWPGQSELYVGYPSQAVAAGGARVLPSTKVMVHNGDWHKIADAYRKWFLDNFDLTYSKTYEQALEEGITGPKNKYTPEWFKKRTSWYSLTWYYSNLRPFHLGLARRAGGAPLLEIEPCSVIDHRTWMYDIKKYRKIIDEIHRNGGKIIAYVQGYCFGTWGGRDKDYPVNVLAKKWSVMNEKGQLVSSYPGLWYGMCPAVVEWQDFLAETSARMIRELGVDGIRLDSLGAEIPRLCYNTGHSHYPKTDVWNQGVLEILRKVKTAIRKEKPDAVLLTEDAIDSHYQYVDASLKLRFYFYNNGVNIERYTFAGMRMFGIGMPSDYDSWAKAGRWTKSSWADGVNMTGVNGVSPSQYDSKYFCSPLFLNWMKASRIFTDALFSGDVVDINQPPASRVLSRLFKARDYYLLAVTRLRGGTETPGRLAFSLKDIDGKIDVNRAVKLSMRDFSFSPISVGREADKYNLSVECGAGEAYLIFLPKDNARSIALISSVGTLTPGRTARLKVELLDKSARREPVKAVVRAPGLIMAQNVSSVPVGLPATMEVAIPDDSLTMTYQVSVEGPGILGSYVNIDVVNLSTVQTIDKKELFDDDFDKGGIDPKKWDIVVKADVPETKGKSPVAVVEAGVLHLVGQDKKSSSVSSRFKLPPDSFLTFDFYQPADEVAGYMSTVSYKEPGRRQPSWYMEFSRERWFFYTFDSTKGGWHLRGNAIAAKSGKWYTISIHTRENSCSITITDRQNGLSVGQKRMVYDSIKGGGRVTFSAASNGSGKRGMKLDNVKLKTYIARQPVYRNGDKVYLKIVQEGSTPPNKITPLFSIKADFSGLDSLFQADKVFVEEDYFKDDRHVVILVYRISRANREEDGLKDVPVTVVDVNDFHPMTVPGIKIRLENTGSAP